MKGALASALRSEDRLQLHHIFHRLKANPPVAPAIFLRTQNAEAGKTGGSVGKTGGSGGARCGHASECWVGLADLRHGPNVVAQDYMSGCTDT